MEGKGKKKKKKLNKDCEFVVLTDQRLLNACIISLYRQIVKEVYLLPF